MTEFVIVAVVMIGGAVVLGTLFGLLVWKVFTRPLLDEYDEWKERRK